jgi:hypothetical protein
VNFVGYVALRRGLLSHIQEGRLTNNEALTFVVLLMLADKATGSGTINSPALRSFMPGLSHDAAKRALLGLEEKHYIFRQIVPFSKRVYRFWVNLYVPSTGPYRSLQINLSQVFESGDINDIRYVELAPEGAPQGAPQTPPQGAHHYKKDKDKEKETTDQDVCASECDTVRSSLVHTAERKAQRACGSASERFFAQHEEQQSAQHSDPHEAHQNMHQNAHQNAQQETTHANDTPKPPKKLASPEDLGMSWCERENAYRDAESGRLLSWPEFQEIFSKGATQ